MTQAARPILKGEKSIDLRRDTIVKELRRTAAVKALVAEEDEPLLSALKAKRRALADDLQAPAYVVFPDATLIAMATSKPRDLDGFAALPGVGAKKLTRYGKVFLEVINGAMADVHPARRKLAGRDAGGLYDQLQKAQLTLSKGHSGLDKPLVCSASLLSKIAEVKPQDIAAIERLLGSKYADRFGEAFLDIIRAD